MIRTVSATRYVVPLREGGSLPALIEGDDDGLYVVKFRGAGQGPKALIAELVSGELARAAGLLVPELVLVELALPLADTEPDPEICELLQASAGVNLGLDYLPGSVNFDPIAEPAPDAVTASRIALFDALVANVDRTPKNPNLLVWHRRLWLIDHGASLYFHHGWRASDPLDGSADPFPQARQHVLLPWATALAEASDHLSRTVTAEVCDRIVRQIPSAWLGEGAGFAGDDAHRAAYGAWLTARLRALPQLCEEAERARAQRV